VWKKHCWRSILPKPHSAPHLAAQFPGSCGFTHKPALDLCSLRPAALGIEKAAPLRFAGLCRDCFLFPVAPWSGGDILIRPRLIEPDGEAFLSRRSRSAESGGRQLGDHDRL
jgi:hypothetical protein